MNAKHLITAVLTLAAAGSVFAQSSIPTPSTGAGLSRAEVIAEYQRAHLFLHPSELTDTSDQEGIPNSMLEAMATGLPVVATHHGGIPEAVTHGVDSLLVPERSPEQLAEAILSLLRDPALRVRLSTAAAQTVRQRFGLEASIARLEDCYDEAIRLQTKPE